MNSLTTQNSSTPEEREPAPVAHADRTRALGEIDARIDRLVRSRRHGERLDALVELVSWLAQPAQAELIGSDTGGEILGREHARLALFTASMERSPGRQAELASSLEAIFASASALSLFAEGGLRNERGLLVEMGERLARRLLPKPREELDLSSMLPRLFPDAEALRWISSVPARLFERTCTVIGSGKAWLPVRAALEEALCLLAARVRPLGLSQEMRERHADRSVRSSPCYALSSTTENLLSAIDSKVDEVARREAEAAWSADVLACRRSNEEVRAHLETSGVSVELVYALDVIERHLDRMVLLFEAFTPAPPPAHAGAVHALVRVLVRGRLDDRSLRALLRDNMALIARKVIERTGETGEHYITTTRAEWARMWVSAGGGGLVTTFTAAIKLVVTHSHFPILVEFFLAGWNYALSFIVIQLLGFTLATKQPAMTAASLAATLDRGSSTERSDALADHVARIVRSQLAAAFGNILAVAAGAVAFVRLFEIVKGCPFLTPEVAEESLRSLDPLRSGTIFFAIITGVVLWLSGIVAGWMGNWIVYRRLPQAIAEHRLGDRFGPHRMQAVSRWFATHVASLCGSVALGFLLAAVPALGMMTGLPLQVRHVTLSAGQLVLSAASLSGETLDDPLVRRAAFGIAVIFVANLGTSFLLALAVAARARKATFADARDLGRALRRHMLRRPLDFFVPPRTEGTPPAH